MSNMSYCRFRNTLQDLQDCAEHISDELENSPEEERARQWLIKVCREIAADCPPQDDD